MARGQLTRWFEDKGFGFARIAGTDKDVFVWGDDLPGGKTVGRKGLRIEFETRAGKSGQADRAKNIKVLEKGSPQ